MTKLLAFAQHLQQSGFTLAAFSQRIAEGESRIRPLTTWLESLPKPVGILTFDDKLGERVLTANPVISTIAPTACRFLTIHHMRNSSEFRPVSTLANNHQHFAVFSYT